MNRPDRNYNHLYRLSVLLAFGLVLFFGVRNFTNSTPHERLVGPVSWLSAGEKEDFGVFALSPLGRWLVAEEAESQRLVLFALDENGRPTTASRQMYSVGLTGAIRQITWSPDERFILVGDAGGRIAVVGLNGQVQEELNLETTIQLLAFTNDNHLLVATQGRQGKVTLWSWPDLKPIWEKNYRLGQVAFDPVRRQVAISHTDSSEQNTIDLLDLSSRTITPRAFTLAGNGSVSALSFSPNGQFLAAGHARDGTLHIWDSQTLLPAFAPVKVFPELVTDLVWRSDGRWIAAVGYTLVPSIAVVMLPDQPKGALEVKPLGLLATHVAFSPDGKTLILSAAGIGFAIVQ